MMIPTVRPGPRGHDSIHDMPQAFSNVGVDETCLMTYRRTADLREESRVRGGRAAATAVQNFRA